MTRKRYTKLMRMVLIRIIKKANESGVDTTKAKREVRMKPALGCVIKYGEHKGEVMDSYLKAWEYAREALEPIYGPLPKK